MRFWLLCDPARPTYRTFADVELFLDELEEDELDELMDDMDTEYTLAT